MGKLGKQGLMMALAVVLVFCSLGATAGFAEEAGLGDKAKFTDTSSHWANKYISKMAMLDIVRGYTDGTFRPDNNVTRQEAVLMALRLLGLEDDAESATIDAIYGFDTDAYFKRYVDYAFSIGLISNLEELSSNGRNGWGTSSASREWIAKLTIRVIDEEESPSSSVAFSDSADVSAWAVGYVNAAAELGIVTGSNGKFNPQNPVTRAELATFFSRAEPMLETRSPRVSTGTVTAADSTGLTVRDSQGFSTTYQYAASPALYSYAQNTPIAKTAIGLLSNVLVIHDAGVAYYVEVLEESAMERATGVYVRSDLQSWKLTLDVNGLERQFSFNSNVSIVSADGSGMNFASVLPGSEIEVTYVSEGAVSTIQQIKVLKSPINKSSTATLMELSFTDALLTVHDLQSGELEEYALDVALTDGSWPAAYGDRSVRLDQLASGDEIRYEVVNSVVTDIALVRPVKPLLHSMNAKVDFNNTTSRILYVLTENGEITGYPYADKVEVTLEGKANATLADIAKSDEVTMYLDENNRVVKVDIANRSITTQYMAVFYDYDELTRTLTTRGPDQRPNVFYYLTDETVVTDNGVTITHDKIDSLLRQDDRIDIKFSTGTNELFTLTKSNSYEGTIAAIDSNNMLLTVQNAQGDSLTFALNSQTTYEISGSRSSRLSNFSVGDPVSVTLSGSQSVLASVKRIDLKEYTVVDVNTSTRQIKVRNAKQEEETLTIPSTAVIRDSVKQNNATITDIDKGETVVVRFVGRSVAGVDIPAISFGRITAVDAEAGTFTMEDYSKSRTAKTFELQDKDLNVNDRVYVRTDVDGSEDIQVLITFEKTFSRLDAGTRTVYFLKKSLNDKNIFQLHENAVIRRNNAVVSSSLLSSGTQTVGYMYNDTVFELVIQ